MMKSFKAYLSSMDSPLWSLHIPVPEDIYLFFKEQGIDRVIVRYMKKVERPAAFLSDGQGMHYFMINKAEAKTLGLQIGDELEVEVQEDKSKYGMPMPDEMLEVLKQDPEADRYFHELSPGKQRSLLYVLGKPKLSQTRLEKAIITCEHLKESQGKPDFKVLNQSFKNSRFKA
jgi:bifunctional DNA-binding transcriptional regulator/antitoxin component of YhaV-PrlF toxin-antitoxin module